LRIASFMCKYVHLWPFAAEIGLHKFPMSISLRSGHVEKIVEWCPISEVAPLRQELKVQATL
jgi:hypothetical protein